MGGSDEFDAIVLGHRAVRVERRASEGVRVIARSNDGSEREAVEGTHLYGGRRPSSGPTEGSAGGSTGTQEK